MFRKKKPWYISRYDYIIIRDAIDSLKDKPLEYLDKYVKRIKPSLIHPLELLNYPFNPARIFVFLSSKELLRNKKRLEKRVNTGADDCGVMGG